MLNDFFYGHPGYVIGPAVVGVFVLVGLAGQLAIFRLVPPQLRLDNREATVYMASIVGVIYAVLLAFIAVAVWDNFIKAGEVAAREASQIGNLYRSSRLLDDGLSEKAGALLERYVTTVLDEEWPAMAGGDPVGSTGWILLERTAGLLAKQLPPDAKSAALLQEMLSRLHDVYDARGERLQAAEEALEPSVWAVELCGALISLLFCWIFGTPQRGFHLATTLLVATAFGLVMFLIVAFDRPYRGTVQIGAAPFIVAQQNIARLKATPRLEPEDGW